MDKFEETRFQQQIDAALGQIKTILENTRSPTKASEVGHSYTDKFALVEFVSNSALASMIEVWQFLGFSSANVLKMKSWSTEKSVSLRFISEHHCSFSHKKERKVESSKQHVTKVAGLFTATDKVVTNVTDYFWNFTAEYSLFAFHGSDTDDMIPLKTRKGEYVIKTSSDVTPEAQATIADPIDLNITWLLQQMSQNIELIFSVNRNDPNCYTPRQNSEINAAFQYFTNCFHWVSRICSYFTGRLFNIQSHDLDLSAINDNGIFVPILPLFENAANGPRNVKGTVKREVISVIPYSKSEYDNERTSVLLESDDLNLFLQEQNRGLRAKINDLAKVFPEDKELITRQEANLVMILKHSQRICQHFADAVDSVEDMLRQQLIQAIGKEVTAREFDEYMRFHFRKLFKPEYDPKLFCYAIRRPDHAPEGVFSIETERENGNEAICSIVKKLEGDDSIMKFPINAATKIRFSGERYVHAWISHKFSGSTEAKLKLIARARQFSSFILLLGTVTSHDEFQPNNAVIIKNKDDLLIPLLTEVIPTPKAFKKSVESLSSTQREFAKAFRSMQLESTLFALCIIQIKPQMEKLLRLPENCLTKEIRLAQDLMELFIDYQIPSDLISFEPEPGMQYSNVERVSAVKRHVAAVYEMIAQAKQKEIDDARMKAKFDNPVPLASGDFLSCIRQGTKLKKATISAEPTTLIADTLGSILYSRRSTILEEDDYSEDDDDWSDSDEACGNPAPTTPAPVPVPAPAPKLSSLLPPKNIEESKPHAKPEANKDESKPKEPKKVEKKEANLEKQEGSVLLDFTKLPGILNKKFDELDTDAALHATILKTADVWNKKFQKGLLSSPSEEILSCEEQSKERNKAFDLLDALSRSGGLCIDSASFHVVVAATHCFDQTLINTIVKDNVNPIEKVERSGLIVSSTIHEESPSSLIKEEHLDRVKTGPSSHLF